MQHFHLIVLIFKQRKIKYWIVNQKMLTNFYRMYKSILVVASDLNLGAIKGAFTRFSMRHFNIFVGTHKAVAW